MIAPNGQTQLMGVIGWPVAHSLSPIMHNAALAALGLNACYVAMPVRPDAVGDALRGLAALSFRGVNVTVPHKCAVIPELSWVAPEALALGAVNTVVIEAGIHATPRLLGYNTDVPGFLGALRAATFEPSMGARAIVVGAGGAARAVVYALNQAGMRTITVLNRTVERAQALIADLIPHLVTPAEVQAAALTDEALVELSRRADLLVNTTTVGMWPHATESIWPSCAPLPAHLTVYDLVYNPLETALLRQARQASARTIDGLGMLARQGALALDLWTTEPVDVDAVSALMVRAAAERLVGHRREAQRCSDS